MVAEGAEAAGVGLVEAAMAVGDGGPLLQEVVGVTGVAAERGERPVVALAALGRLAAQLPDLLLGGADDEPLLLPFPPEQLLQPLLRSLSATRREFSARQFTEYCTSQIVRAYLESSSLDSFAQA
jgi:hypothetical protein